METTPERSREELEADNEALRMENEQLRERIAELEANLERTKAYSKQLEGSLYQQSYFHNAFTAALSDRERG